VGESIFYPSSIQSYVLEFSSLALHPLALFKIHTTTPILPVVHCNKILRPLLPEFTSVVMSLTSNTHGGYGALWWGIAICDCGLISVIVGRKSEPCLITTLTRSEY
jgi:hypothetical protein